jgi:hypothetical protein
VEAIFTPSQENPIMDRRPGKDEIVVQAVGVPDGLGRVMFFAHWQDLTPPDAGGPTDGIRAQIFDVNLDDFMIRQHAQGKTVRYVDHEPEWEPAHQTVSTEDLRNVVNLASEIEDRTEEEARSIDRLRSMIGERDYEQDETLDIEL